MYSHCLVAVHALWAQAHFCSRAIPQSLHGPNKKSNATLSPFNYSIVPEVQDCLQMTPDQKADVIRLRAECFAKHAENQARWLQLCNAITDVRFTQILLVPSNHKYNVQALATTLSRSNCSGCP